MTHQIRVYGIVQGVGFRPTVARHAAAFGIRGTVSNKGPFVEILAEAEPDALEQFETAIRKHSPKRAVILKVDVNETRDQGFSDFSITESEKTEGEILISPDIAICEDCKKELYDKKGRRYLHPFINCTCCGPRLTILDALPYDRVRTSMKEFPMCPPCAEEYGNPGDRRYDAQPVCCNDCGPVVYLLDPGKKQSFFDGKRYRDLSGLSHGEMEEIRAGQRAAITQIRKTIAGGGIVAVKGIGGYHICCDALNEEAVDLLRERKKRPAKPFAVMMRDMETVKKYCRVSPEQEEILTGHQKPIILLQKRENCRLASSVAPGNPTAGVMLPYAPVQLLLFNFNDSVKMPDALVMTSANFSGAPIVRDEEDALKELSSLCDEILAHNRKIRIRADDTVMDFYRNEPCMIRRSRGYAPLPVLTERLRSRADGSFLQAGGGIFQTADTGIDMREGKRSERGGIPHSLLAIGGELKNSFCIRVGKLSYMSPYIGDLTDIRTVKALKETVKRFMMLLEAKPEAVVCDLHPKYMSVQAAEELAGELGLPLYRVQHHYAHVLSCLAENDEPGPVVGISMDGTGYGEDGSIWGGEILLADTDGYERAGCIMPFRQIGGDAAAREGWRIAVSMIYGLCGKKCPSTAKGETVRIAKEIGLCGESQARVLMQMSDAGLNTVKSTSCGRLFDAVSAILGIRRTSTFEGEASMALQFAAERGRKRAERQPAGKEDSPAPWPAAEKYGRQAAGDFLMTCVQENPEGEGKGPYLLRTDLLFAYLLETAAAGREGGSLSPEAAEAPGLPGEEIERLAYAFHAGLAEMIAETCVKIRRQKNVDQAALTGGCFQNKLLLELTEAALLKRDFKVLRHRLIPPNDGGLALGQAAWTGYAAERRGIQ